MAVVKVEKSDLFIQKKAQVEWLFEPGPLKREKGPHNRLRSLSHVLLFSELTADYSGSVPNHFL